jgi:4-hydroxy-4-methyl-2-oxoglutarate aldolase
MGVVVISSAGPDEATVADLAHAGVATVHEAMGRVGLLDTCVRPVFRGARIAGRAVTVLTPAGDNLMIHAAIEQCRRGDVLVVATMSLSTDGMFGELLATGLQARGVAGIVIDAGVRDVAQLTAMGFPAWSRAISAQGTVKDTPGSVNVPVMIAGQFVRPGDVIVADDDGVVVVPLADADKVAAASLLRLAQEESSREAFRSGTLSLDSMGLRPLLGQLGVVYVDADGIPASPEPEPPVADAMARPAPELRTVDGSRGDRDRDLA